MPLFVAQHQHSPETCPASAASQLLCQISASAAARHGVTIEAEALIDGEHRLLLVLDAPDRQAVETFLASLLESGELRIFPASTAEQAVRRGGCLAAPQSGQAAHR